MSRAYAKWQDHFPKRSTLVPWTRAGPGIWIQCIHGNVGLWPSLGTKLPVAEWGEWGGMPFGICRSLLCANLSLR